MTMPTEKSPILSEEKVLACLMRSRDFCSVATQHIKPSYFAHPVRHNIAKMAIDYYKSFNSPITLAVFSSEVSKLIKEGKLKKEDVPFYAKECKTAYDEDISDSQYVLKELISFIKNSEWRVLIEEAVKKHLPKGNFLEIEKKAAEIAAIKTSAEVEAMDYFSDAAIDERTEKREKEALMPTAGISTGIKRMDDAFPKKGWYPKELYIIMAPAKRGKTQSLLWFGNSAAWQGFNASYFTCEVSKQVCAERLDALNTSTEINHISIAPNIREIAKKLKNKKPPGKLFIYEYPTKTLTTNEIERQLNMMESKGVRIDLLIVDYGDIMKPSRYYDNYLKEEASIFEDLRGLAGKFNIPVLTATQVNRDGSDKEIIRGKNVAGSWEKIMIADAIISLSASETEIRDNTLKVHFAECRNMPSKTLLIKTNFAKGTFYESFIKEAV